jgi:hypothetical protein
MEDNFFACRGLTPVGWKHSAFANEAIKRSNSKRRLSETQNPIAANIHRKRSMTLTAEVRTTGACMPSLCL